MAQTIRDLTGDEVVLRFDETLAKLAKALPKDHPVVKEVSDLFELAGSNLEQMSDALQQGGSDAMEFIEKDHDPFITVLQDWRRGIRDWDEVEEALKDVSYFREGVGTCRSDASGTRSRRP